MDLSAINELPFMNWAIGIFPIFLHRFKSGLEGKADGVVRHHEAYFFCKFSFISHKQLCV